MNELSHFKKIGDYHKLANLPAPEHPLISLVNYARVQYPTTIEKLRWRQDYYTIGLKRNVAHKLFYGQQEYDFDQGLMTFVAPQQVMSLAGNPNLKANKPSGYLLLVHPDFLWNSDLAKKMSYFEFFGYGVRESLFLSQKEEKQMVAILKNIQQEYQSNIDKFSQKIIISQLELLLNYAERYYERQFITRKISNHETVRRLEGIVSDYFKEDRLIEKGLPTVQMVADSLNLSPNYLSSLLKSQTGQSTQQHIHNKLIEKAKEQLSTTTLSVSEIAYSLGFEHHTSFTKLFKNKTEMTPLEFRKAFN
ncbi:MAG: helix-turn-helix transcriptional regulator [Maribacter sp.]|uniref:helix-turn-helix domain-containing protein n=1 Tax=Maribacter sp. TaxID=1897614 RepID=UPI00329848F7